MPTSGMAVVVMGQSLILGPAGLLPAWCPVLLGLYAILLQHCPYLVLVIGVTVVIASIVDLGVQLLYAPCVLLSGTTGPVLHGKCGE